MPDQVTTWLEDPGPGRPCTLIAEIAQAHDGSLGLAHAYIDSAAAAGADAVKFQTHIASAESTLSEPWRTRFSHQDTTRFDYWKRMEFTDEQWHGLKRHADEAGLMFLSSPFSLQAVDLLKAVGVAGWKVASGEVTNLPMLQAMAATGQPVLLSTGMSPYAEIDAAVEVIGKGDVPFAVFQCTTQYPSPPDAIGLNVLEAFRSRYRAAVGLSDHSGTIFPALAAATLGVDVVEVHITMSREMFGPDVAASVTTAEFADLVRGVRFIERMRAAPVDKSEVDETVAPLREIFLKSVVATADLPAGTVLDPSHVTTKKPGTGIPASAFDTVIGRKLARAVERDVPLVEEDLEV
ncbi:MAG: N-acetylneuraminate synthase family protein [Hyphomicrobiales bacterium]